MVHISVADLLLALLEPDVASGIWSIQVMAACGTLPPSHSSNSPGAFKLKRVD